MKSIMQVFSYVDVNMRDTQVVNGHAITTFSHEDTPTTSHYSVFTECSTVNFVYVFSENFNE